MIGCIFCYSLGFTSSSSFKRSFSSSPRLFKITTSYEVILAAAFLVCLPLLVVFYLFVCHELYRAVVVSALLATTVETILLFLFLLLTIAGRIFFSLSMSVVLLDYFICGDGY